MEGLSEGDGHPISRKRRSSARRASRPSWLLITLQISTFAGPFRFFLIPLRDDFMCSDIHRHQLKALAEFAEFGLGAEMEMPKEMRALVRQNFVTPFSGVDIDTSRSLNRSFWRSSKQWRAHLFTSIGMPWTLPRKCCG